jgi:hypothetical protein
MNPASAASRSGSPAAPGRPVGGAVAPVVPPREAGDAAWWIFLGIWGTLGLPGLLPVLLVTIPTFIGIAIRPAFGLCLTFAVLPIGRGLGVGTVLSADRGMAILFALGIIVNLLFTRKRLVWGPPVWTLLFLTLLGGASIFWAVYPEIATMGTLTLVQILVWISLVLAVGVHERDLVWPLRAFVVSCVMAAILLPVLGISGGEKERFTMAISAETTINPNTMACMFCLGILTCVYLYARDPVRILRLFWVPAIVLLALMATKTGSRTAIMSLGITFLLPVLLLREVVRRPGVFAGLLLLQIILGLTIYLCIEYFVSSDVAQRLISVSYREKSFGTRLIFIQEGVDYALRHPLGAGINCYAAGTLRTVHNDLFYCLSNLGWLGALVFGVFAVAMIFAVRRTPPGWEKWYVRAVVIYLLASGLSGAWIFAKHYWAFMTVAWLMGQHMLRETATAQSQALPLGDLRVPPGEPSPVPPAAPG